MSDAFRRTTVITPPAAFVVGNSYAFECAGAADYLYVGRARIFPSHRDRYDPDDRQGQLIDITAVSGATVTATLRGNPVDGLTRTIKAGYWVLMDPPADTAYVVNGSGYALTRAGATAAVLAASVAGGGDVVISKPGGGAVVFDATAVERKSHVNIRTAPGTWVEPPAGAGSGTLFHYLGAVSTARLHNGSTTRGSQSIVLAAGGVAALGLAAGDPIVIFDATLTVRLEPNEVLSVAGDTVQLRFATEYDWVNTDKMVKVTSILEDSALEVDCRAGSNTGTYFACETYYHRDCDYRGTRTQGFATGTAFVAGYGWYNDYTGLLDRGSGNIGYDAIEINLDRTPRGMSGLVARQAGFGIGLAFSCDFTLSSSRGAGGTGRQLKFASCRSAKMIGCEGNGDRGGYTGIMVSGSSKDVDVIGCTARGNAGYGMQTAGEGADGVRFIDCVAENNVVADIVTAPGDSNVDVINPRSRTALFYFLADSGIARNIRQRWSTSGATPAGPAGSIAMYGGNTYFVNGVAVARRTDRTVTMTIAAPCVVTWTGHGLANDTAISFSTTGALPTGLLPYDPTNATTIAATTYYVRGAGANTFNVAHTPGGANIDTSGSQSGVHTINAPTSGQSYKFELSREGSSQPVSYGLDIGATAYVAAENQAGYDFAIGINSGLLTAAGTGIAGHSSDWQYSFDADMVA